jgi:hypothetical protein
VGDILLTPRKLALPWDIVERFNSLFSLFGKPLRIAFFCLLNLEQQFKISRTDPGYVLKEKKTRLILLIIGQNATNKQ